MHKKHLTGTTVVTWRLEKWACDQKLFCSVLNTFWSNQLVESCWSGSRANLCGEALALLLALRPLTIYCIIYIYIIPFHPFHFYFFIFLFFLVITKLLVMCDVGGKTKIPVMGCFSSFNTHNFSCKTAFMYHSYANHAVLRVWAVSDDSLWFLFFCSSLLSVLCYEQLCLRVGW